MSSSSIIDSSSNGLMDNTKEFEEEFKPVDPQVAPEWLSRAIKTLQMKFPKDKFEIVLKAGRIKDFRVKCHDCGGRTFYE